MRVAWLVPALLLLSATAQSVLSAAVINQPILFVVRNQYHADHHNTHTMFPSAPNEFSNGYYEGGNSALKVFDPAGGGVRTILAAGADGVIRDPDVHFSGTRIVFAWRKSLADCYHIYEINADGTGLKQLTALPDVDDFDPIYLPDDRIVTWVDLNAVYYPSYASNYPDNAGGRSPLIFTQLSQLAGFTGKNVYDANSVKSLGEQISFDRPEKSPCLSGVTGANYTQALALIQAGQAALAAKPREDMSNCTLQCAMDIWRENKYQDRLNRERMNQAAVAAGAKVYDSQPLLAVTSGTPTGVDGVSANINGSVLYSAGNQPANVRIAWGTTDAGDDPNLWQHLQVVGWYGLGAFTSTLSGLVPGQVYYYRVFATNALGLVSSHLTGAFDTRSLIDMNGNGMADSWEIKYFGGTNVPGGGPFEDWDGDGVCNLDEYVSGTDPTHADSCLKILSFDYPAPDRLRIQWQSAEKCVYTISSSSDLTNWVDVSNSIAATPPANVVELPLGTAGRRFFRVGGRHLER